MLSVRDLSAGDIARHFDVSGPAISQHLKVLREANLVRVRVDAQRRIYQIEPSGLQELALWLSSVERLAARRAAHF
jgi:DNA-binding transcriptional ArsR family regulator